MVHPPKSRKIFPLFLRKRIKENGFFPEFDRKDPWEDQTDPPDTGSWPAAGKAGTPEDTLAKEAPDDIPYISHIIFFAPSRFN